MAHKLFDEIGPRYADRPGGYTRILKLGPRHGDNAPWPVSSSCSTRSAPPSRRAVTLFSDEAAPPGSGRVIEGPDGPGLALTVAYLGHRVPGLRRSARTEDGGRCAHRRPRAVAAPHRRAHLRRPHRCRGPRVGTGRHLLTPGPTTDPAALQRSVNKALGPAIVVRRAAVVPATFDARRSATGRRYRYTVLNQTTADPFLAATSWHVAPPLDRRAMQLACDPLYGEHDFSSFCRRPSNPGGSLVRRVRQADWVDGGDGTVRFDIEASSFCQQMVRALVGTMVEVGLGRRRAGEMSRHPAGPRSGPQPGSWRPPTGCASGRSPTTPPPAAPPGAARSALQLDLVAGGAEGARRWPDRARGCGSRR